MRICLSLIYSLTFSVRVLKGIICAEMWYNMGIVQLEIPNCQNCNWCSPEGVMHGRLKKIRGGDIQVDFIMLG
jgi:hypothetical protein